MKTASGEPNTSAEAARKSSWPLSRWLLLITLVFAAHVALIFAFGTRTPIIPGPVMNVPELQLVTDAPELKTAGSLGGWLALNNPTLFALPNREGFAWRAWLEPQRLHVQMQDWTEKPRFLPPPTNELGAVFGQFMQTNRFAAFHFESKPPAQFTVPEVPLEPPLAQVSTLRVEGSLIKRPLLTSMKLPSWPYANVLLPSKVQVLVNPAGNVVSATLLSSSEYVAATPLEITPDQRALDLARAARFAPASGWTVGQLIFDWHTIVPIATNGPPIQ